MNNPQSHRMQSRKLFSPTLILLGTILTFILVVGLVGATGSGDSTNAQPAGQPVWSMIWSDEFNGSNGVNLNKWIYDTGSSYPGGTSNWGTHEVELMSNSTNNVFQSGGSLNIRALHTGAVVNQGWTSGRIETMRTDFQPPVGGKMAVEARIRLPNVTGAAAQGYWPAFWLLGAPFRNNYQNWPSIGEIDVMENINGLNQWWGTLHCGPTSGGPCHEAEGISQTISGFSPSLQSAFHTYRIEYDKSVSPQQIRWYVDGVQRHIVSSNQMDPATWNNATNHGFFIILNLAIGGDFPNGPTVSTASGGTMLVDYVRIYYYRASWSRQWGQNGDIPAPGDYDGDGRNDLAVFRPSNATWYVKTLSSGYTVHWGQNGDIPAPGDYDGDGRNDLVVFRPSNGTWYVKTSSSGYTMSWSRQWGQNGDIPAPSDYDGDGRNDLVVFRPSNGTWYVKTSSSGYR